VNPLTHDAGDLCIMRMIRCQVIIYISIVNVGETTSRVQNRLKEFEDEKVDRHIPLVIGDVPQYLYNNPEGKPDVPRPDTQPDDTP
jgi:hypothetical protein